MRFLAKDNDTICALSTPPGRGGIAVVRVSGPQALKNVRQLAGFLPVDCESHRSYFGRLKSAQSGPVKTIDEALVAYFAEGKSYTGEETLEISTHGSPHVVNLLLEELTRVGCRPAERGEFTYRAFMNGKLDLVQAEAVLSLIESQSRQAAKNASRQLTGELSQEFQSIEDQLIRVMAHLEAGIDFSTEDIAPFDSSKLLESVKSVDSQIDRLIASFSHGRILQEGYRVAIVGRPNAGKSSLLNAIVQFDCAIVTDTPGTTRDVVAAETSLNGVTVKFLDTAGIRETKDRVEKIGIERSFREVEKADLTLVLIDLSQSDLTDDAQLIQRIEAEKVFIVGNKKDISYFTSGLSFEEYLSKNSIVCENVFEISALDKASLVELLNEIEVMASAGLEDENHLITSARQVKDLGHIKISIKKSMQALKNGDSPEFAVFEMQEAVLAIHRLLGKQYDDQVMDRVFNEFCIGK